MGEGIKTRRGKSKGVISTYLYNVGNSCTPITGGWYGGKAFSDLANTGSGTLEAGRMRITGTGSGSYGFCTTNLIDLRAYSKLIIDMEQASETYLSCRIYPSAMPVAQSADLGRVSMTGLTGRQTVSIDISAINEGYIICYAAYMPTGYIYSVKLEG